MRNSHTQRERESKKLIRRKNVIKGRANGNVHNFTKSEQQQQQHLIHNDAYRSVYKREPN